MHDGVQRHAVVHCHVTVAVHQQQLQLPPLHHEQLRHDDCDVALQHARQRVAAFGGAVGVQLQPQRVQVQRQVQVQPVAHRGALAQALIEVALLKRKRRRTRASPPEASASASAPASRACVRPLARGAGCFFTALFSAAHAALSTPGGRCGAAGGIDATACQLLRSTSAPRRRSGAARRCSAARQQQQLTPRCCGESGAGCVLGGVRFS